jgi:hypothetical protein
MTYLSHLPIALFSLYAHFALFSTHFTLCSLMFTVLPLSSLSALCLLTICVRAVNSTLFLPPADRYPHASTMEEAVDPADITADGNSTQLFFRMRQSWPMGQEILFTQLWQHARTPTAPNATDAFADMSYLSQAVHAHCLALSSLHFRMQRSTSAATAGLLFWSLNEQWQGQSDAAIDYAGRWKLLHYAAARFYSLVVVAAVQPKPGGDVTIGVANDWDVEQNGVVDVQVIDSSMHVAVLCAPGNLTHRTRAHRSGHDCQCSASHAILIARSRRKMRHIFSESLFSTGVVAPVPTKYVSFSSCAWSAALTSIAANTLLSW